MFVGLEHQIGDIQLFLVMSLGWEILYVLLSKYLVALSTQVQSMERVIKLAHLIIFTDIIEI